MEIIQSIIGFFIAIGILVTFHEFGHFIVARFFNVTVLNFSIGFGKSIYSKKFPGEVTEYSIGAIPLGGYVKMLESGEMHELDKSNPNFSEQYCFDKQSVYKRFLIVAAGPIFNLLLAVIFFILVHLSGITGMKPLIDSIDDVPTAVLSSQDKALIIKVNDVDTKRWQDVRVETLNGIVKGDDNLILTVLKDNGVIENIDIPIEQSVLKKKGDIIKNIGFVPSRPDFGTILGDVQENSAASLAGLQVGDKIISINDDPVYKWSDYVKIVQSNPNNILRLEVERNTELLGIILVPSEMKIDNQIIGFAGISPSQNALDKYRINVKYPLVESINKSITLTVDYTLLTFKMIFKLFSGQANVENISGPLSIAEFSGKSLAMGYVYFVYLMAVLSISLGVLNLLPIPMLDGGHLVYYTIEMIIGKPVSMKIQLIGQQVGIVVLLSIMVLAFYNDFLRIFSG